MTKHMSLSVVGFNNIFNITNVTTVKNAVFPSLFVYVVYNCSRSTIIAPKKNSLMHSSNPNKWTFENPIWPPPFPRWQTLFRRMAANFELFGITLHIIIPFEWCWCLCVCIQACWSFLYYPTCSPIDYFPLVLATLITILKMVVIMCRSGHIPCSA